MSKALTTQTEQDKQLEIELTEKFNEWHELYFDKSNKKTYLNATQSAIKAYPNATYGSARVIGSENLTKLNNYRQAIADELGYTITDMMKIGIAKMIQGNFGDWERMMQILGHVEDPKHPGTNNNFQFNLSLGEAIAQSRKERGLE